MDKDSEGEQDIRVKEVKAKEETATSAATAIDAINENGHGPMCFSTLVVAGIQPLPGGNNDPTSRQTSQPGAIYVGSNGLLPGQLLLEEENPATTTTRETVTMHSTSGTQDDTEESLAVANLVDQDEQVHQAFPDHENARKRRRDSNKKLKTNILLAAILLIAMGTIVVTVTISASKKNTDPDEEVPTLPPSQAPTSLEGSILSLFSDETIRAIATEDSTPQSKAWQWLWEDQDSLVSHSNDRIKQRFALATLYYATAGNDWNNNTNWLNHSIPECEWYTKPDFATKAFTSSLYPGVLSGFLEPMPTTNCNQHGLYQHLWLDRNNLVGSLPEELYILTSLQTLSVGFNAIQGTISSQIGALTALEGLGFASMGHNGIIPSEIGLLSNLQVFAIDANDHHGNIPTDIWSLTNLRHLSFGVNPRLQGTIPSSVGKFQSLRWLLMDRCNITGTIPSEIGQLSNLEMMTLTGDRVAGTLPSAIGLLQKLRILSVFGNLLHGTLPSEMGQMSTISLLGLAGNQFSGALPSEFGLLTQSRVTLSFRNNALSGTIPTELGLLSQLAVLEFQGNQFTGRIPSEFGKLSSIGRLTFANNSLSGTLPNEFSALHPSLHTLALEGNPLLSGTIPKAICNMNATCAGSVFLFDPCDMQQGLSFDCTGVLCGCDDECSCF
ncbi:Leucine Rich Repeat [Seminavis robusta]|uniref:Leucine Rich Repeat n=1 Tax=Seminavis robusta TaxID=568900 RepID=A0A9N8HE26_9STRA|nr:Leucine Rich Repeat [Seminavis robusta]|eukprot:Sro283_g107740.1 Leucine Rich Repeat (667) ;mRNA; r:37652-39719